MSCHLEAVKPEVGAPGQTHLAGHFVAAPVCEAAPHLEPCCAAPEALPLLCTLPPCLHWLAAAPSRAVSTALQWAQERDQKEGDPCQESHSQRLEGMRLPGSRAEAQHRRTCHARNTVPPWR